MSSYNISNISRRSLGKGAVWSVPAVAATVAIPAYAASNNNYEYRFGSVVNTSFITNNTESNAEVYNYKFTIDNTRGASGSPAGATVSYDEGKGVDTIAHFEKLIYRLALPKSLNVQTFTMTTDTPWIYQGITSETTFELVSGTTADLSDYDVHVFEFTGVMDNAVVAYALRDTWPGTTFAAVAESSSTTVMDEVPVYHGYTADYFTDNGWTQHRTHFGPRTLRKQNAG